MAEVQRMTLSGQMAQKFIQFVMLQSQQASLFLGKLPNPQTGRAEVNLDAARMFLDHLEMLKEKTTGNLSAQEAEILDHVLADLHKAFDEASRNTPGH